MMHNLVNALTINGHYCSCYVCVCVWHVWYVNYAFNVFRASHNNNSLNNPYIIVIRMLHMFANVRSDQSAWERVRTLSVVD